MKFQIGDTVETNSQRFEITEIYMQKDQETLYSAPGVIGYKEADLHLVEEPLKAGDLVEIIGPDQFGGESWTGNRFIISQVVGGMYSRFALPWYPAASLRKVQPDCPNWQPKGPLKVGDLVEVIGPSLTGATYQIGDRFLISQHRAVPSGDYWSPPGMLAYSASSLRKLSPEEVAKLPQVSEIGKIHERLNWLQDQIDTLTEASDERFDSIEHRQGAQQGRMDGHGNGLHDLDLRVRSHTDQIRELNDGMALVRALSRAAKEARS